jgi:hypothetical protein
MSEKGSLVTILSSELITEIAQHYFDVLYSKPIRIVDGQPTKGGGYAFNLEFVTSPERYIELASGKDVKPLLLEHNIGRNDKPTAQSKLKPKRNNKGKFVKVDDNITEVHIK